MRVYFDVGYDSYGISRAALNIAKYMPKDLEVTTDPDSADLVVIHVNGRHDHNVRYAQKTLARGAKYVVVQYVLGSCRNPNPEEWKDLWDDAKFVWSYYDLGKYIKNFYHAPLAADPEKFYVMPEVEKQYLIGTNGNSYDSECLGEVRMAAYEVNGKVLHVGPEYAKDPMVTTLSNISDDKLRECYNMCRNFSALRRKDGFEMVAIESLLCGVRPIMFDTPNYRQWFDGLVEFIPEGTPAETMREIRGLLRTERNPVTLEDINEVKRRFNWEVIIKGFWDRCLS